LVFWFLGARRQNRNSTLARNMGVILRVILDSGWPTAPDRAGDMPVTGGWPAVEFGGLNSSCHLLAARCVIRRAKTGLLTRIGLSAFGDDRTGRRCPTANDDPRAGQSSDFDAVGGVLETWSTRHRTWRAATAGQLFGQKSSPPLLLPRSSLRTPLVEPSKLGHRGRRKRFPSAFLVSSTVPVVLVGSQ